METMPLTRENLLRHNGCWIAPPSTDPVTCVKTRFKNTLRGLKMMGPEGFKTIEECDICTDGSTLSYRGSDPPEWDSLEFWERHMRPLDGKFQTLCFFFNYQLDENNRLITDQHCTIHDAGNENGDVRPWILAITCEIEIPPDGIWHPPPITPFAEEKGEKRASTSDCDKNAEASTPIGLKSSCYASEGLQIRPVASQEIGNSSSTVLKSTRASNRKRAYSEISSS
ncbi:hypothetical protein BGZ63DRAFT_149520 [Mariannaea sp. PMI_226]|nr:hypothetical protein BGZ63DRAFT_149520 [Mariannaea sp. PMI_226]